MRILESLHGGRSVRDRIVDRSWPIFGRILAPSGRCGCGVPYRTMEFLIAPAGSTLQRIKNATALIQRSHSDSLWRLVVIGTVWRSGLAYDGCDELDATAGGLWPRSRWYCSNQPSRIMTAGRKS